MQIQNKRVKTVFQSVAAKILYVALRDFDDNGPEPLIAWSMFCFFDKSGQGTFRSDNMTQHLTSTFEDTQ